MNHPAARQYAAVGVVCCVAVCVYIGPATLARSMTSDYHVLQPSEVPEGITVVVVLGSGVNRSPRGSDTALDTLNREGVARTLEAARLFHVLNPAVVITSGGKPDADQAQPSGVVMRDALVALGVPAGRIVIESESQTTHDEAVMVSPMLRRLGAEHLVVVTSPIHMPRSLGAFRAEGWQALPAVAVQPDGHEANTAGIMHELIGIPYYRLRGWYR